MIFQKTLTIPAETEQANPTMIRMHLTAGTLSLIHPLVPSGCYGLTGVRIMRGGFQLWPMNEGEWFVADGFTDTFPMQFELDAAPYEITIEGYNLDETYDHSISFRVEINRTGDPGLSLLGIIEERIPSNLQQLVLSVIDSEGHSERMVSIMRDELLPILQASLEAQQHLVVRSYDGASLRETLTF